MNYEDRKLCYRIEILYNKYIPVVISIILFIYHLIEFNVDCNLVWIEYLCMPSLFTVGHMFNSRIAFKLCKVHKCFVLYVASNLILCIAEQYWVTPYMNTNWFVTIFIGTVFALILMFHYYIKEHEKFNS